MSKRASNAVRLTAVSKNYKVYTNPGYWLVDFFGLGRWIKEGRHYRSVWALQDVSLEIPVGSKVALVGRNGAGKSTLLRLISGNSDPTIGTVEVNGHCEALLELGTGFYPEFTGRDNIYTALAYQGVTGQAAREKFSEIVDFAELDEFINQPIRTYSSGMYLRLAFSVATTIVPKILIIDEVLAAGDMYFQAKCLERIDQITSGPGTTVIFVSHNLDAAERLCDTFIWLDRGRVMAVGPSREVRAEYEHSIRQQQQIRIQTRNLRLSRNSRAPLQKFREDGTHLLGRFVLESDNPEGVNPHIASIGLYVHGEQTGEIQVGDAADDNLDLQTSYVISDPVESTWSSPQYKVGRMCRAVQADQDQVNGAKFALFLPNNNFNIDNSPLELAVTYQNDSSVSCHLELSAGTAGLKRLHTLEPTQNGGWQTTRIEIPRWIYAPRNSTEGHLLEQNSRLSKEGFQSDELTGGLCVRLEQRFGTGQVLIKRLQLINELGEESYTLRHGQPMSIILTYEVQDPSLIGTTMIWSLTIHRVDGVSTTRMISTLQDQTFTIQSKGRLRLNIDSLLLTNGTYLLTTLLLAEMNLYGYNKPFMDNPAIYDLQRRAYEFVVQGAHPVETGIIRHPVSWEVLD